VGQRDIARAVARHHVVARTSLSLGAHCCRAHRQAAARLHHPPHLASRAFPGHRRASCVARATVIRVCPRHASVFASMFTNESTGKNGPAARMQASLSYADHSRATNALLAGHWGPNAFCADGKAFRRGRRLYAARGVGHANVAQADGTSHSSWRHMPRESMASTKDCMWPVGFARGA